MPALGGTENNAYVAELQRIIRAAGLLMPFTLVAMGLLTRQGYFNPQYYYSDLALVLICVSFTALGIWNYLKARDGIQVAIAAILFHLLAAVYLLFITGLGSPITIVWLMMLIGTDLYFGRRAYILSIITLLLTLAVSLLIHDNQSAQEVIRSVGLVGAIAVTGLFISVLHGVGDNERAAFSRIRKKESLQHERLTTLINGMGDAVISTNADGTVKLYNAAALNLLDTNQTLTGRSVDGLLHLVDDNKNTVKLTKILSNTKSNTVIDNYSHRYEDGEEVHLYISIAPFRPSYKQAGQQGYILVLRDITKEKSLEEERDEFISVVSHELRTPIAITEGAISNLALMNERGMTNDKLMKSAIASAHEQVVYLAKMINDLSTLSRAERGVADEVEQIDVSELVHTLYSQYRPSAEAKGLALNLDAGPNLGSVMASRLYLEEVLQNFITNSIKYTKEGSVTLKAQRSGGKISFAVTDTGIGISKTDQKRVYDKFYRSEDYRTRETSGTGLGLYVVRKLASKLKIDISLKSRINHGSTFSFDMPVVDNRQ